jgi:hypothetical protein
MKTIYFILYTCLLLVSCTNGNSGIINEFKKNVLLEHKESFIDNRDIGFPKAIVFNDRYLVLLDIVDNYGLALFDKQNGNLIKRFGNIGKGPNELMSPQTLELTNDGKILVYDSRFNELFSFSIDSLLSGSSSVINKRIKPRFSTKEFSNCMRLTPINDTVLIGTGWHPNGRLFLFNNAGGELGFFYPEFPYDKLHKNENYITKGFAFQYNMKYNGHRKLLCLSAVTCQHIEIYEVINNKLNKKFDHLYKLPVYDDASNEMMKQVIFDKESKLGFQGLDVSDDFIFLSYASEKMESPHSLSINDYILKLDWNGTPLIKYRLDCKIGQFATHNSSNEIYAISENAEGLPCIVKFSL